MKNDKVGSVRGSGVAVAIHVLELVGFLYLFDQVLIQRELKIDRELHFVRLDHENLN